MASALEGPGMGSIILKAVVSLDLLAFIHFYYHSLLKLTIITIIHLQITSTNIRADVESTVKKEIPSPTVVNLCPAIAHPRTRAAALPHPHGTAQSQHQDRDAHESHQVQETLQSNRACLDQPGNIGQCPQKLKGEIAGIGTTEDQN